MNYNKYFKYFKIMFKYIINIYIVVKYVTK